MDKLKKLQNFWKNKNVFITGHTGFKGTWFIIFLNLLGANVYGLVICTGGYLLGALIEKLRPHKEKSQPRFLID